MKNYKSSKTRLSKKSIYLAVVFIVAATLIIVAVSIKRSLNSSNFDNKQQIVKFEVPKEAVPTNEVKNDVKKSNFDNMNNETKTKNSEEKNEGEKKIESKNVDEKSKESVSEKKQSETKKKGNLKFVKPLEGTVLQKFSGNELVLSKTLNDFRTHNGIDIEALPQTPVKAICDGTVVDLFNDKARWGTCVIIKHESGLTSIYRGLDDELNVKIDSRVNAGQIIGTVGQSNMMESALESHLHLEIKKGDDFVDPLKYVKYDEKN